MVGLLGHREAMIAILPAETWFVVSTLLAPVGYVVQDAVADAMTVEAVPLVDDAGRAIDVETSKLMHTTMQTLGRVAIIGGSVIVAVINLYMFAGVPALPAADKLLVYSNIYEMALVIPLISVLGVVSAALLQRRDRNRLVAGGMSAQQAVAALEQHAGKTKPNWWILGGGFAFVAFTLVVGLSNFEYSEELIFAGSFAIVVFLIAKLTRALAPDARATLIGTAIVIFIYRAVPSPGPGATWWMIDDLNFDGQFLSVLSLISSALTLAGMFLFRRFMAERSIAYVIGFLTLCSFVLSLPTLGMYYGLHHWTAAMTNGVVDARFIALVDTALESPLGQIAMIPMLAWIARSAPADLKATYFAIMASFTNLALSLSQLGTKYLNQWFVVAREVKDAAGAVQTAADYSQLGVLLIVSMVIGLVLPFAAIMFARVSKFKSV
jgi:hypothetical protein